MRFLLLNHIQNAKQSLKSSRVRSTLTMIGTAIGVASVTAILAIGGGASNIIKDQINLIGGNIIIVKPGSSNNPLINIDNNFQPNHGYNASSLTEYDIESIQLIDKVKHVSPIMILGGSIKGDLPAPDGSIIVATNQSLADISNLKMSHGKFFDNTTKRSTVILGTKLSRDIFETENSIGRRLSIQGKTFTVVGILDEIGEAVNYNSINYNKSAIISFTDGKTLNNNAVQIQQIDIQVNAISDLDEVSQEIKTIVKKNHDGETDFSVLSGNELSKITSDSFYIIVGFTTAIAAISMIVGGVGIMNIMLVTVAERTREIGIRKALGATNGDIVCQFLIESIMLGIGGGAIGYFSGYIIAFIISRTFFTFLPTLNWIIAILAIIISVAIGAAFGLYPAIRAARKNPIQSLQSYN